MKTRRFAGLAVFLIAIFALCWSGCSSDTETIFQSSDTQTVDPVTGLATGLDQSAGTDQTDVVIDSYSNEIDGGWFAYDSIVIVDPNDKGGPDVEEPSGQKNPGDVN